MTGTTTPPVVHVVPYYPPHIGGMENVARVIAEGLAEKREVLVLTSRSGPVPASFAERRGMLVIRRLLTLELAHLPVMPMLLIHLVRVPRRAVVHVHLAQAFVPEMVWMAGLLRRRPYIVHFHLDVEPSGPLGWMFVAYKRWVLGPVLRAAATVIVVAPDQPAFITSTYRVPPEKIEVFVNGVGPEFYLEPRLSRGHDGPFRLLFVGRLSPQKNVTRLLHTIASVTVPVEVVIVGDGEERASLDRLRTQLGLYNVRMVGAQVGADLVDWYRWADAFLLTSDREGTGLVLLEAMAAGLPVIAGRVQGVIDTVGEDGILAEPEPSALAGAVERLVADPALWADLARRSSQRAEQVPWTALLERLEVLYERVIP
ncbi:MAG: glycosyltransferase family 4 protein [Actinobacteria bacterium]|nr:glycosyltransferase family 4 protein [Actinomycetota bacterium]